MTNSILLEFSMFPIDVEESKSEYVSAVVKCVRESGYEYKLTPMATIVEFPSMSEALSLVKECYEVLETKNCNRIYSVLKFDIRVNSKDRIHSKIKSVEDKIGRVNK